MILLFLQCISTSRGCSTMHYYSRHKQWTATARRLLPRSTRNGNIFLYSFTLHVSVDFRLLAGISFVSANVGLKTERR
jgi:hypothetical protein